MLTWKFLYDEGDGQCYNDKCFISCNGLNKVETKYSGTLLCSNY